MSEEFLTVGEIAKKLRVKVFTVREYIRKKQLIAYKFGREYRVKVTDYERFVEQHRTDRKDD